ncbi:MULTISPECIES: surface-adhesin E family protein [unclassified Ralstonia]|uniref:surface-adhesin E family protein n=1 Tax=unclassified Ralstonia TaxID=209769 RepID=UPI002D14C815|nr:surface-adhesin E family protein [Ralstonia sp.]HWV03208.1 surface-adhesin E family protein [Ralstonia sp.]
MKTGGWRWQSAIAATALVAAQWAAMPVSAQTVSASAAVPTASAQAVTGGAAPVPESASTDSRWRRFESINGIVSYIDRQSVKPEPSAEADADSHTVHFRLLRNVLPDFTIKTADGQPIRSSVKQVVLDCARHSYTVIAQTLYRARNASGKPLYQIHYGDEAQSRSLREGSVFEWIAGRFCGVGR